MIQCDPHPPPAPPSRSPLPLPPLAPPSCSPLPLPFPLPPPAPPSRSPLLLPPPAPPSRSHWNPSYAYDAWYLTLHKLQEEQLQASDTKINSGFICGTIIRNYWLIIHKKIMFLLSSIPGIVPLKVWTVFLIIFYGVTNFHINFSILPCRLWSGTLWCASKIIVIILAYLVMYLDSDSLGRIFSIETPTKKVYKHLKTQKKTQKI